MKQVYQMEYRGFNIYDEISTVELAIDEEQQTLHIFDPGEVVVPIFNFDVSAYELSENFYKMADVLRHKNILTGQQSTAEFTLSNWLVKNNVYFYVPNKRVRKYVDGCIMEIIDVKQEKGLFEQYIQRV